MSHKFTVFKLPFEMYLSMIVVDDKNYPIEYYDKGDYATLEIIEYCMGEGGYANNYRISFKNQYRLSGIDGTIKNIILEPFWKIDKNKNRCKDIIKYIRDIKDIRENYIRYPHYKVQYSEQQKENKVLNSDKFFNESINNKNSMLYGFDYKCYEYVCIDLDSEDLDAIIYPAEYEGYYDKYKKDLQDIIFGCGRYFNWDH